MCAGFLNLALLLSLCGTLAVGTPVSEDTLKIISSSGADCVLECTAEYTPGVQYRAVRWYKVIDPPSRLSGILTKDLPNGTTQRYVGVEREVELWGETNNIFLPNVTCEDRGMYSCHLPAPVGEQNREGQVLLILTDCSDSSTSDLMTDCYLVAAIALLVFAFVIFLISYNCLKKVARGRNKTPKKEILIDAALKPLEKKDMMLIYTLGPKKTATMKHYCV